MGKKIKIGIIGFGNMGFAIVERLKPYYEIYIFDKDKDKTRNRQDINVAIDIVALVKAVNAFVVAVKPQDFDGVLDDLKDSVEGKLAISIAAGIPTAFIEKQLRGARVMRVMPNLPAKVGKGMICVCRGKSASDQDLKATQQLFKNLGRVLLLNEEMIDAATAISGSGPGYLYDWAEGKSKEEIEKYTTDTFIPSLTATAIAMGFTPQQAHIMAKVTGMGSIQYLQMSHLSPSELKKQVASKGGTTEAALEVLHRGGSLTGAAQAAYRRARELSNETCNFSS